MQPKLNLDASVRAPADKSMTIAEFCVAEGISRATYFKLVRTGHGPATICLPGTRVCRITYQARLDWHRKMADAQSTAEATREHERRKVAARRAGQLAAASPRHVSKQSARGR